MSTEATLGRLLDEAKVLADDRPFEVDHLTDWSLDAEHMIRRLVKAFNEQPAQPQQEPVAWVFRRSLIQKFRWHRDKPVGQEALLYWEPLYTSPPAQEFVCSTGLCHYRKENT